MRFVVRALLGMVLWTNAAAQPVKAELWYKPWPAAWIEVPGTDPKAYGVYKFRRQFALPAKPASFKVHVSGDNRYKLFVNGQLVALGPTRGDLYFWNFETVDLAPYLRSGDNVLAALVWNDGPAKPEAQISFRSGFVLQADDSTHRQVNTGVAWRCTRDSAYTPRAVSVPGYYVAGPAEAVDMRRQVSGWELPGFNDSSWRNARVIFAALTKGSSVDARGWMLVPSPIPQMELTPQRFVAVRGASGAQVQGGFPAKGGRVTIPANSRAVLLVDNGVLTNAYPTLVFSGGRGAGIAIGYTEAMYLQPEKVASVWSYRSKGHRDSIAGKVFVGKTDSIISNGLQAQVYTPLWWRTYRYVQLTVTTGDEPIVLDDLYGSFTGYPFEMKATFSASDPGLQQLLDVGWRTARLCAFETYMDCPYYEQLQYIGDARIQALVSLYNSGDDRLVKYALDLMDRSRIAEGITLSRYPTDLHQQIPTFSLWYIGMLHDYWRYRPDSGFVREKLAGARQILHFFEQYQQPDGSLRHLPYWIFTDWVPRWPRGIAPLGKNGTSSVLDLQLAWTYQVAAELEQALGVKEIAGNYRKKAAQLQATIRRKYWDAGRGLYADTEEKDRFSQHANALALLAGVVPAQGRLPLARKMLADTALAPASIYFKYYLHEAAIKAGLGNDYLDWLGKWRENLAMGLTTWAEMSDVDGSRSDCHAWGSSPNVELYRTVLGIDSEGQGFRRIRIAPHLGKLTTVGGSMPHPSGTVSANYQKDGQEWIAELNLPRGTTGTLHWKGRRWPLQAGANRLRLP